MEQIIHDNGKVKLTQWGKNYHIFTQCTVDEYGMPTDEPTRTATILSTGYVRFHLTGAVRPVENLENFDARSYAENLYRAACKRIGLPA